MLFSEILRRVISLGQQIEASIDPVARSTLAAQARDFLAELTSAEFFMLMTLVHVGCGDLATTEFWNSHKRMAESIQDPESIDRLIERPFSDCLMTAVEDLDDQNHGLDAFVRSLNPFELAGDDGVELQIGPWACDTCRQPIECARDGMLQWMSRREGPRRVGCNLEIVHHLSASPLTRSDGCYGDPRKLSVDGFILCSDHLDNLVTYDGLLSLLSIADRGELPATDVYAAIMRLFVPSYEQARRYFDQAIWARLSEPNPLSVQFFLKSLKTIMVNAQRFSA